MDEVKTIEFDFGPVTINRNNRARNMRIKVHPEKGVSVTLPRNYSEKHAVKFISEKEAWIRKSLKKTLTIKQKNTVFTEQTIFNTKFHNLQIQTHSKASLKFEVKNKVINIWYPEFANINDERIQEFVRQTIIKTLRFEAKQYLPKRTSELAELHDIKTNDIKVRNNKTRWGSCSGKNNINLNIHLMRLPDELIDYVVLHELAHIKHKNHSKHYWTYLESICNNAKILDRNLTNYNLIYW
jgi:predicted metal-dependent hydrolase